MSEAFGMRGREEELRVQRCLWQNLKERDRLEDLGIDERITFVNLREIGWDGVYVTRDRDKWSVRMNTVLSLRFPKCWGVA